MAGRLLLAALTLLFPLVAAAAGFEAVAPGAYVLPGPVLSTLAPPEGEGGNVGLVVGRDASVLFDTGASHRQGAALLAALRDMAAAPVRLAVVSHALPEFLFGATAVQEAAIPLIAHRRTAELIAQRCDICLERFRGVYGEAAMWGSRVPEPDRMIEGSLHVDLGDRRVEILDFGAASTPGDLAVLDPENGVLYAGGLVVVDRIPSIRDADLRAWIAALDRIAGLPIRSVVPGHGPVVAPECTKALRIYLARLDAEVRRLYAAQASLGEAVEAGALADYAGWAGYPEVHRQNVQILYLALERAELEGR